ncbi:hypothetical protein PoB_005200400 [Plakobranchus ocellatus]|uniref:Uncharacterized protein n=1 Tax=Plakobranchus ocellatus TaxID=259542 RepID=A0AAV4C481_9GAST|nr:hypothetical protein PoB_005200400 [Plakobranchus ocellatus]
MSITLDSKFDGDIYAKDDFDDDVYDIDDENDKNDEVNDGDDDDDDGGGGGSGGGGDGGGGDFAILGIVGLPYYQVQRLDNVSSLDQTLYKGDQEIRIVERSNETISISQPLSHKDCWKSPGGGVGSTVACEFVLRSAGTLLSRVRAPLPASSPDGGPESLRSPCYGLAIYKKLKLKLQSWHIFHQIHTDFKAIEISHIRSSLAKRFVEMGALRCKTQKMK